MLPALACAAALALAWLATARLSRRSRPSSASEAEVERARAADRSCLAAMRLRDPTAAAEADVRAGIVQPIVLAIGDDTRFYQAPGLPDCASPDLARISRDFPATCEGDLTGPHRAVVAYSLAYNRRLMARAPRQVAAACERASLTGPLLASDRPPRDI
jgi:hypothetical protein